MQIKITNDAISESIDRKDEDGKPKFNSYDLNEFTIDALKKNIQTALDNGYEFVSALELKQAIEAGAADKKIALVFTEAFSPTASLAVMDALEEIGFKGHAGFTVEQNIQTYSLDDPKSIELMQRIAQKGYDLGIRMGGVENADDIDAELDSFEKKTGQRPTILTFNTVGKEGDELAPIFKSMEDSGLVSMYDPAFKRPEVALAENSNGLYKRVHPIEDMVDKSVSGVWNILPCWLSQTPMLPAKRLMDWPECAANPQFMEDGYFAKTKQPILGKEGTFKTKPTLKQANRPVRRPSKF